MMRHVCVAIGAVVALVPILYMLSIEDLFYRCAMAWRGVHEVSRMPSAHLDAFMRSFEGDFDGKLAPAPEQLRSYYSVLHALAPIGDYEKM